MSAGQIPARQIADFAAEVAALAPGSTVDYGPVLPDPATYDDGSLFVLTSADPDPLPASAITVDDSGFTQLVGTDVQTVLDNIDSAGVGGGSPSTRWEVLLNGTVDDPRPILTPDGTGWIYVEVPL